MNRVYRLLRLNRLIRSHRVKFAAALLARILRIRHLSVRFDPVMACNLRCRMCYFSSEEFRRQHRSIFREDEVQRIARMFFPQALQLVIGCGAEPTLYRGFAELVRLAKSHGVPNVGFVTNAQLLTQEDIRRLVAYGLDELLLSTHGVREATYETLMPRASFAKLFQVLDWLEDERDQQRPARLSLRINYTVCPDNLEELADFFAVFGKYRISTLQVRPMVEMGGEYRTELTDFIPAYNRIIKQLVEDCRARGVVLLANTIDPTFTGDSYDAVILEAVCRHISPERVWRNDFDWRNETYSQFCRRIHWNRFLLDCIFASREEVIRRNSFRVALKYDVRL